MENTSGFSFLDAVNRTADIFFDRLHRRKSELATARFEDETFDEEFHYFGSDFRGFVTPVKIEDESENKIELTETKYGSEETEGNAPETYRLSGPFEVQFSPKPESDTYDQEYLFLGSYYSHPGSFSLSDELPWEGLFDTEFEDAVILILSLANQQLLTDAVIEEIGKKTDLRISNRRETPRHSKCYW